MAKSITPLDPEFPSQNEVISIHLVPGEFWSSRFQKACNGVHRKKSITPTTMVQMIINDANMMQANFIVFVGKTRQ